MIKVAALHFAVDNPQGVFFQQGTRSLDLLHYNTSCNKVTSKVPDKK